MMSDNATCVLPALLPGANTSSGVVGAGKQGWQHAAQERRDGRCGHAKGHRRRRELEVHEVRARIFGLPELILDPLESDLRGRQGERQPDQADDGPAGEPGEHAAAAGGAQGLADGPLRLAAAAVRQHQAGHVREGDDEQRQHRREEQLLAAARLPVNEEPGQRLEAQPQTTVPVRLSRPCIVQDRCKGLFGRLEADAVDQAAHPGRAAHVLHVSLGCVDEGHPQLLPIRKREPRRHHADDGRRPEVEPNGAAEDAGIGAVSLLPQHVADEDDPWGSRPRIVWRERSTDDRADVEEREQRRADDSGLHPLGAPAVADAGAARAKRAQGLEHVCAVGHAEQVLSVEPLGLERTALVRQCDLHEAIRRGVGHGFEDHRLVEAEPRDG